MEVLHAQNISKVFNNKKCIYTKQDFTYEQIEV